MTTHQTARGIPFLRTPEDRFADLPDFAYEPHYVTVDGLRMAYIDEGPGTASTILLPHGEPTWGYLYRRMIPTLTEAGHRVIVPDLIGFGRSDKPTQRSAYTYSGHVAWMSEFLDHFSEVETWDAFCQDWGGLITLRSAAEQPERFAHLVLANTGLPHGESLGGGFDFWLELSQTLHPFDCGRLIGNAVSSRTLSPAEQAAYNAPFPDEDYMACVREFPCLVPITPEHESVAENSAARRVLSGWTKPVLLLWGRTDPVLGHLDADFLELIPGTNGQPHQFFDPGNHFIQDDVGEPLAVAMASWLASVECGSNV